MPETYFQVSKDDLDDVLNAYQKEHWDFLEQLGSWIRWASSPKEFRFLLAHIRKNAESCEDGEWIQFILKIERALDG